MNINRIESLIVEVRNLDSLFDGYRIIHLTDLHVGQWLSPERLAGVVDLVNQNDPDLILMTGDYVSYDLDNIAKEMIFSLMRLHAREGKVAVLGNHDYWTDADRIIHILHQGGFTVLLNDVFTLQRGKAILHVAGIDSVMVQKDRLNLVLEKLSPTGPAILLVHEPDFADTSAKAERFDLQLSGHSHGGQIVLPGVGALLRGPYFWKYPLGLYRIGHPNTSQEMLLYTNRGLGTNIWRFRIHCPPEILLITLRSISAPTSTAKLDQQT